MVEVDTQLGPDQLARREGSKIEIAHLNRMLAPEAPALLEAISIADLGLP